MISIHITPNEKKLIIEIPEEMVNKQLHVEIREENTTSEGEKTFEDHFESIHVKMDDFTFDRDEANAR